MTTLLRPIAWLLAGLVTFATLGPPSYRPHSDLGQIGEHGLAFIIDRARFWFCPSRATVAHRNRCCGDDRSSGDCANLDAGAARPAPRLCCGRNSHLHRICDRGWPFTGTGASVMASLCAADVVWRLGLITKNVWPPTATDDVPPRAAPAEREAGGFGFSHIKPGVDRRKPFLHLAAGWRIWPLKEGEGEPE